jgi:hypothetical protein
MSSNGKQTLTAERIEELRIRARNLIEHPADRAEADRRGDLDDILRMAVVLATAAMFEPKEPPEWMRADPAIIDSLLYERCLRYLEHNGTIPVWMWPYLALRFCMLHDECYNPRQPKHGAHAAGRKMAYYIEGLGRPQAEAAALVAKEQGIDDDSAVKAYRRWRKIRNPLI